MNAPDFIPAPEGTRWPSGDGVPVAGIPITEDELSSRLGVPLLRGVDDGLGEWAGIGGFLPSGAAFEFVHYKGAPDQRGLALRIDKDSPRVQTLEDVLRLIGMSRADLLWEWLG